MDSTSVCTPDGGAHDERTDDESSVPNLDSVRFPSDWRRHAASSDADDGSIRGHGLATTPSASAALIFRPLSDDDLFCWLLIGAGEEHRLPADDRNEDLLVESLADSGGELFLSTATAVSAGRLPRFSANGDDETAVTAFIALSEWWRTFCGCTFFTGDSIVRTHMSAAPSSSSSSSPPPPFSSSSVLSANVDVPESTSTGGLWSPDVAVATTGLTAHPFSNLLINAEADKSSSGSTSVVGGDGGSGSGSEESSSNEMIVCGGGGGGNDEAITTGSDFLTDGTATGSDGFLVDCCGFASAGFLAGTVVNLVCSPLGGTGGGFCLADAVDVLTGGVGAPPLPPPPPPVNVCKTDADTGVCSGGCDWRWSAAAVAAVGDDDGGAAAR